MSDLDTIKRDIAPFTDPATSAKLTAGTSGCRFQLIRQAAEQDYFLTFADGTIVARHANNRKYGSFRSLLASADFADMRSFASTQARMNKDFALGDADTTTRAKPATGSGRPEQRH
jgi:hypothetical protein